MEDEEGAQEGLELFMVMRPSPTELLITPVIVIDLRLYASPPWKTTVRLNECGMNMDWK